MTHPVTSRLSSKLHIDLHEIKYVFVINDARLGFDYEIIFMGLSLRLRVVAPLNLAYHWGPQLRPKICIRNKDDLARAKQTPTHTALTASAMSSTTDPLCAPASSDLTKAELINCRETLLKIRDFIDTGKFIKKYLQPLLSTSQLRDIVIYLHGMTEFVMEEHESARQVGPHPIADKIMNKLNEADKLLDDGTGNSAKNKRLTLEDILDLNELDINVCQHLTPVNEMFGTLHCLYSGRNSRQDSISKEHAYQSVSISDRITRTEDTVLTGPREPQHSISQTSIY